MIHPTVLLALLGLVMAEVPSDSPRCDASTDATLKKTFPDAMPKDLLDQISKLGPVSVLTVVAPNIKQLVAQDQVCSQSLLSKDKKTVQVTRKLVPGALPQKFTIEEKDGLFSLTSVGNPKVSFSISIHFFKDGVGLASTCCKDCTGDGLNLKVIVVNSKKADSATHAAIIELRQKLNSIKLDIPFGMLSICVEKEV